MLISAGLILSFSPLQAASTDTAKKTYWAIFGEVDVSTDTPGMIGVSTGPATSVILKSATTPDCYTLVVSPNGTLSTKWIQCPK